MAELQIACLGDFQVTLDGSPLTTFQTDKSRALLAYLAIEQRAHQRTNLAQFLWPGYGEESARNSLRQVLYQLRQLLPAEATAGDPPPWLLLTRQTVQLNPAAPINVDVLTFTRLLAESAAHTHHDLSACAPCLARLRQAVALYQGDFLSKLGVVDSDEFEEWRRITQEQLHIQMLNALIQLAAAAEAAGDDEQAIQMAHRLLTLEPWLETAHRQIMRLLAQRGQRAAALAQYQRCRQVLAEELGVEPDEETTALYEQIRSSQVQTPRVTPPVLAMSPLEQPAAPVKPAAWLAQLPPLLGRADELAHIATLLDQPTCRLVTLVGPPGVGKTRLAQAVLAASQFEHGCYFIELAALRDPTLLAATIAHALTAAHPTQQFTGERLIERLRDQALLLVLDNFEQVLPGVTLIGELLTHCPRLKLLLTSRAPLHLGGEQIITVHPLSLPALTAPSGRPPQDALDLTTVAHNAAVQLFCQRAAAVVPDFALTERLAPVVVEICHRLDGLPLAIELAAAHSRLLPPPALLERLTQRLALLTSRSQARPERQQTLRAAIAWSYDLLEAEEQRLFRQLTVFAGGATLSAIEAVVGNGADAHAPFSAAHSLLAGLEALLDKNLLRQAEWRPTRDEGESRVLMLETLREYGWALLAAAEADDPVTQKRHADYFLNLAETTAPKLHGPDQVAWLDRLALDHDNLRAALAWFVQANEVHKALRLATALRYFWRVRGHYREGSFRLLAILAQPEAAPAGGPTDAVRARALNAAGYLQWVQGNTTAAQDLLQEALTLSRAVSDAAAIAFALRYLGLAADARQEGATARQWLEESLAIYRTLDTPNETALALMYLGDAAFGQRAYDEAERLYQESAELLRHLGNNVVLPYALRHLGYLALARGKLNAALRLCTESLRLNLAAGEQQGSAAAVTALAAVAAAGERWAQAARLLAGVTAWLTASGAQLLPIDRRYYEQTHRLLQQQPQPGAGARLPLEQALAYVQQELTFADELGGQDDKVTSDKVTSDKVTSDKVTSDKVTSDKVTSDKVTSDKVTTDDGVTLPPSHLVTLSPHPPIPPSPTSLLDWSEMPAIDFLAGRTAEVAQLTAWLAPSEPTASAPAQIVSVLGLGGIGKTTLAAAVVKTVAPAFAVVIWRSLLNAPPLSELLRHWLQLLSRQTLTVLPDALDEQLRLLLTHLRQERCLLVLDNVESIFAANDLQGRSDARPPSRVGATRPGYEGYDQLFQWLASSDHQSCLLLTSREQPYALAQLAAGRARLRVLALAGLDPQAGQALLQSNGLATSVQEAANLVETYSGNPLALQIVAAAIADFFGGDVVAFQHEEGALFDGIRLVLDQQFARLSPLERDSLVWLAIEREPISVQTLRANLVQPLAAARLLEALRALQNRSLLEKRDTGLTLQNVIIEYTTEHLVEQVYQEILEFSFGLLDLRADDQLSESPNPKAKIQNSFLNRFALLKAQAREDVRQSQVRLILQPLANRLLAQLGKAQVEERVAALIQRLQTDAPLTPGYAGGNLLNLLLHIGSDLRGRNFAHLTLWQAFLRGAYVPEINLTGADLTGAVFTQRFSALRTFQFDANGDLLVAEVREQRLRLIRLMDGLLYKEIALPDRRIFRLMLSPACNAVAMLLDANQLALLDLTTGQLFPPLTQHKQQIWQICFSPDGSLLASGDGGGLICIWDRHRGQLVQTRQISTDAVSALAIAPDGQTIANATVAGTVFLWSLGDPSVLQQVQGHNEEVATLTFLQNGTLLASGSHDATIGIWEVASGELRLRLCGHTRPIRYSVATGLGSQLVTGGGDRFLYVWDWQDGAPRHLLTDHASAIEHLVMSADGKRVAAVDLNFIVSHWEIEHGQRIDFYPIYQNTIMSIHFSPDGKTLASGGSDAAVYLWQVEGAQGAQVLARLTAHNQRIFAVAIHPAGELIASGDDGYLICLWARSSGRLLHTLQGHKGNITMLAFSPNGQWLASSSSDGTLGLWSLPDGRQRRRLQVHTNGVTCCAFSPRSVDSLGRPQQRLASGSLDHTLAIWDAETGTLLHHLRGHTNAIGRCLFSHDGQRLISTSYDQTLRIWDTESGQPLAVWPQGNVSYIALALHPAGEILAVSCSNYTIRLLELKSGRCLTELQGHSQIVISLCFQPNGQLLASAGADETIKFWDFSADALDTGQITCLHTVKAPAPYTGMKITSVTGINEAQKAALCALGAVEE